MDWSWAVEGITDEVPRTTGPECINYMTNYRRWTESLLFSTLFLAIIYRSWSRLKPIALPPRSEIDKPHSAIRLTLMIVMSVIFGIEIGFKFAGKSMLFILNPCHMQTMVQIYLLAAKPSKTTTSIFRIQMNNLNGPFLAFLFPEVDYRTLPFEQATYWIQHALLYIIPIYLLRTGVYEMESFSDYNWIAIGVSLMLLYHFFLLSPLSILTDINLDHMLCAAVSDPFQGPNYRVAAVIHQTFLCPILNKGTIFLFGKKVSTKYQEMKQHSNVVEDDTFGTNDGMRLTAGAETSSQSDMVDSILTHRRRRYSRAEDIVNSDELLLDEASNRGPIMTTEYEYPMPTTKID